MNARKLIRNALLALVAGSLLYAAGREFLARREGPSAPLGAAAHPGASPELIVYYFSQGKECVTCDRIESYTREALETHFADELTSGEITWLAVDVDEPKNEHFVTEYELYTKSVVLVRMEDGRQVRWKNLADVWDLVSDQPAFTEYVRKQVQDYLNEAS